MADRPGDPGRSSARALEADDPARLDQLLALPRVHLIVDGYNVTKRGFGDLSLEQQRSRLVAALAAIAAQTGAETTVVFDGADKLNAIPGIPRGLRVLVVDEDHLVCGMLSTFDLVGLLEGGPQEPAAISPH